VAKYGGAFCGHGGQVDVRIRLRYGTRLAHPDLRGDRCWLIVLVSPSVFFGSKTRPPLQYSDVCFRRCGHDPLEALHKNLDALAQKLGIERLV
jgi:hypothetical protein